MWLPIVTPFRNGRVDVNALQPSLARSLSHHGGQRLHRARHHRRGGTARPSRTDNRVAGAARSRGHALCRSWSASAVMNAGAATSRFDHRDIGGYLVPAPAYICPDQRGIQWHFEEIARATDRPIVLYDVPHRSGVAIAPDTAERLVEVQDVVAIKACVPQTFQGIQRAAPTKRSSTAWKRAAWAVFWRVRISSPTTSRRSAIFSEGRTADARARFKTPAGHPAAVSAPNPSAVKAALSISEGHIDGETRMPIAAASDAVDGTAPGHAGVARRGARIARPEGIRVRCVGRAADGATCRACLCRRSFHAPVPGAARALARSTFATPARVFHRILAGGKQPTHLPLNLAP